jgi:hypothetical protein
MNMKSIAMTAMAALVSCTLTLAQDHDNDNKKKIEGSGNVITKERSVQPFDAIDASGVYHLVLIQGNKEEVKIEADDNLQELFEVTNEGSKLKINMKKDVNFNAKGQMRVTVTFKKVKALDLKMVGGTSSEGQLNFDDLSISNKSVGSVNLNLATNKLNINNKAVGNFYLSGKANEATIVSKAVGNISAENLVVQKMDIDNDGVGGAVVNAEKELSVKDSFLGKVRNKGNAVVKKRVSS